MRRNDSPVGLLKMGMDRMINIHIKNRQKGIINTSYHLANINFVIIFLRIREV